VWPQNLVACTLLNTLHAEDEDDGIGIGLGRRGGKGMSRYKFFLIVIMGAFFFFFLPGECFFPRYCLSRVRFSDASRFPVRGTIGVLVHLLGSSVEHSHQSDIWCTDGTGL
jgi:hypothetical protein